MPTVKPGFTTSEWWSHILTLVVAVGVAVAGVIHPGYTVPSVVAQLAGPAAAALAAISTAVYAWSRTQVKTAALGRPVAPVIAIPSSTVTNAAAPATVTIVPGSVSVASAGVMPDDIARVMTQSLANSDVLTPAEAISPNVDAQTVAHPGAQAAAPPLGQ